MSDVVDPTILSGPLDQALAVLHNSKVTGVGWLHASDVSALLREQHGLAVQWRTIASLFDKNRTLVARKKKNRRWQYSILGEGEARILGRQDNILLIDPKNAVHNVASFHDLLSTFSGSVDICDPYCDSSTIEHLDSCTSSNRVRLLTHNVNDTGRLRQLVAAFNQNGRSLEIRVVGKAVLHDRYVINKKKLFILGTSLNGFGKKQSFVINAGQDFCIGMKSVFQDMWNAASAWP